MKRLRKNILALFVGCFIAAVIFEIFLQIYNPFRMRVSGNEIELPANQKYEFHDVKIAGLDSHIVHTKNSMGFRGPEFWKPESGEKDYKKFFFVGGSTTECFYLSDGEDWPALISKMYNRPNVGNRIWMNNAGLDGHSTRGHIILLRDHLLKYKPSTIFFLIGCNDVAAEDLNTYENGLLKNKKRFLQNFETYNLLSNLRLAAKAKKRGMGHQPIDFARHPKADTTGWRNERADPKLLAAYGSRIKTLINMCLSKRIEPFFITQPTILSNHWEHEIFFGNLEFQGKSGLHYWNVLNDYNQTLIQTCEESNVRYYNLARWMWQSPDMYYDFFHFTKKGADKVGGLIYHAWWR